MYTLNLDHFSNLSTVLLTVVKNESHLASSLINTHTANKISQSFMAYSIIVQNLSKSGLRNILEKNLYQLTPEQQKL